MAVTVSNSDDDNSERRPVFFVLREFLWGAMAGAFGEGLMHPVDTVKTRIQSQVFLSANQNHKSILQMVRSVWLTDGVRGFYRGVAPGITGSLATGATYFGVIESTKGWIEESHPDLAGHWAHFITGSVGDTLGSFIYVPCEVIKQRMQVQGMIQAGCSIWKEQGYKGLYAGYWSTLARDVPFAGLMVMFYEGLKDLTEHGKRKMLSNSKYQINSSLEGLVLGGLAGGLSAYLTTPMDVIKTRLQVQGSTVRYTGWFDTATKIWETEGIRGMFRGSVPRVVWYVPASALTFMAVEFLRAHFNDKNKMRDSTTLSLDKRRSLHQEVS
uniref:Mitochondrial carrier protein n=1 Tax=Kalanchoe fedtschenkoi TaxID=63787 RepID=A0A7N0VC24_KALFE